MVEEAADPIDIEDDLQGQDSEMEMEFESEEELSFDDDLEASKSPSESLGSYPRLDALG